MRYGILKKISATTLAVVMAVSLVPVVGTVTNGAIGQVKADAAEVDHGTCGDNLTWSLDDSGTLTISGSGDMDNYSYDNTAPWYDHCSDVKTIQIEDSVSSLGAYAFLSCSNLSDVKIPKSITSLNESVFEDCDSLKNITIPSSITSIGDYAFYDCDGLEKIYIPASVTSISSYAFDECSSIRRITVSDDNQIYDSRDECNAIIETNTNTLIRGCMNTIIPDEVSGNMVAFSGYSLERVLLNSSLTNVNETDVDVSSEDTTLLGIAGTYITDHDAVLTRINEIREEACNEGVINPATNKPLTQDDYVPISWSYDLEYIARIRAAESSLTIGHKRTNGSEWSVIVGPEGERSWGEVLAWNGTEKILTGIEQWYSEKESWVEQDPEAVTGHYTQMIDPGNLYFGVGTFYSPRTYYANCTAGEFSFKTDLEDTQIAMSGDCVQKLEVSNDVISNPVICGLLEGVTDDTEKLSVAVDVKYDVEYPDEEPDYRWTIEGLVVLDDITWSSSDPSIVSIDADGTVHANALGEATITARFEDGMEATAKYIVKDNNIEFADVKGLEDKTFTGAEIKPVLTVTFDNVELKEGTDYTVSYSNNINVGTATVTIEGKGNYTGTKPETFTINAADIKDATVTGITGKPYIGKAVTQSPVVKLGNQTLKEGTDYTVKYSNNTKVGTATISFAGKGNYTGSLQKTFKILPLFKDVEVGHEFFDPIYWMAGEGYTTGWDDGTFRPWNTCNRAACVTFLWRMAGSPEPHSIAKFSDMPENNAKNQDFRKAISWAVEEGITTGWADNTFRPWNTCNRAAIMTFIWRYAGKPSASKSKFKDPTGNKDFDTAIAWASENGIANGYSDGTFGPWKHCNRAAIAAFLYRYGK